MIPSTCRESSSEDVFTRVGFRFGSSPEHRIPHSLARRSIPVRTRAGPVITQTVANHADSVRPALDQAARQHVGEYPSSVMIAWIRSRFPTIRRDAGLARGNGLHRNARGLCYFPDCYAFFCNHG